MNTYILTFKIQIMDKHIILLKQLFIYYWNSDKPVKPLYYWESLDTKTQEMLIREEIYDYLNDDMINGATYKNINTIDGSKF